MGEYGVITEINGPWRDINRPPLLFFGIDPRGLWVFLLWVFVPNQFTFGVAVVCLLLLTVIERHGWSIGVAYRFARSWLGHHRKVIKVD